MAKYSDMFDAAEAAKNAAAEKAKSDAEAAHKRNADNLAAGKKWLEDVILPELSDAAKQLEGKVRLNHSESVETRDTGRGHYHAIYFTAHPWQKSNYQSYRFEVRVTPSGWVETHAHNLHDGTSHGENFRGRLDKIDMTKFDSLLKGIIDGIVNFRR